jgi:mannose-6-phosphate isomerase
MYRVGGVLKEYAWGRRDGLVPWHPATGGPQAELWFGIHSGGPAPLIDDPPRTLADLDGFPGLPLVKLLSADSPLSIQVHPDAQRAAAGFAAGRRDPQGVLLYADDAEKSEVLIALTHFDTHAGWRDRHQAAQVLIKAGLPESLHDIIESSDRVAALHALLELDDHTVAHMLEGLRGAAVDVGWSGEEISALDRVAHAFPGDPGVLVTVLLDYLRLTPGQALAVPAGVVHSYVEGLALEVMTSSDNVLRLGLTPKTIAIAEASAAIRSDRSPLLIEAGDIIDPPGMPFCIEFFTHDHPICSPSGQQRLVLAIDGRVTVTLEGHDVPTVIDPGAAIALGGDEPPVRMSTTERAVLVVNSPDRPGSIPSR